MAQRGDGAMLSRLFTWRSAISSPESGLSATEHHVLLTLSLHMNELGASCYPGIDLLVEETCGRSASTVRAALERAHALGWIRREVRRGRNHTNEYSALVPSWYENHRSAAVTDALLDARRAAALKAARVALKLPDGAFADRVRKPRNRREAALSSAVSTAALRQENRRAPAGKPPRSGGEDVREDAREDVKQQQVPKSSEETTAGTAAAEPDVTDREVTEVVSSLRGADGDSPKRIGQLAYGLPRSVFFDAVETVRTRNPANPCGLLTHLLGIARAERAAAIQAEFMAAMPSGSYALAPWTADALKRDDPERYVRLMSSLPDADLAVAVSQHSPARVAALLELAARVRAGEEPAAERETSEQARLRWVTVKGNELAFPINELHVVIDDWQDVDDIERGELHDLADRLRLQADDSEEVAA